MKPPRKPVAKRGARAKAAAAPSGSPGATGTDAETDTRTTFPAGSCDTRLPVSESFHDVTFGEFKRLNVNINNVLLPIILGDVDRIRLAKLVSELEIKTTAGAAHAGHQKMLAKASRSTVDAAGGGVPIGNYLNRDLSDVHKPLFADVHIKDVYDFVQKPRINFGKKDGTVKVALSDDARADLMSNQPVLMHVRSGGKDQLVRLLPKLDESSVPLLNEYHVGTVDDFLRNPYLEATDGAQLRVSLTAQQLKELKVIGQTRLSVGTRKVQLRAAAVDAEKSSEMVLYKIKGGGLRSDNQGDGPSTSAPPPPPKKPPRTGHTGTGGTTGTGSTGGANPGSTGSGTVSGNDTKKPALQLALYLPWRHRWHLKGYSRGELLHSLALGPQEETTIEISTWDRRKRTFEDSARSEFEQTSEFTETSKDVQSVAREVSNQSEFGLTVGADVGFKIEIVDISARTSASAKTAIANSSKNNLEILRESVKKATNKINLQRETKISESSETGFDNKVTRKVRNPNLCHTLTLNYFEVLAHYDIITEFIKEDARLCVLDRNPLDLDTFNYRNIRYYESVLRRVLLVPALANGFDAAHKLVAQESLCEARNRNEVCGPVTPVTTSADDATQAQLVELVRRAVAAFETLADATLDARKIPSLLMIIVPWPIFTMQIDNLTNLQRYVYLRRAAAIAPHLFDVLGSIDSTTVTAADIQNLAEAINGMSFSAIGTNAIAQDKDGIYATLRSDLGVPPIPVVFTDLPEDAYAVDDAGLVAKLNTLINGVRDAAEAAMTDAKKAAMTANQNAVKSDYSNKEIAEALEAQEALAEHLNRYRNYYRTCILTLMPFPDSFQERLSALPMIERRVLGFDSNEVALPIRADADPRTAALFKDLVSDNAALQSTRTTQSVTLPTSGVHVDARLGECCACEDYITDLRDRDIAMKDVEIHLRKETLAQQKLETDRYSARLDAHDYDDPVRRPAEIHVTTDPAPATTPPASTTPGD